MPWTVKTDAVPKAVRIVYTADITNQDIPAATAEALAVVGKGFPGRFLTELDDADVKLTTLEVFSIFKLYDALGASRSSKSAVVVSESSPIRRDAEFYETVCVNRGWKVRVFLDRQVAMKWLSDKETFSIQDAGDDGS